MRKRIKVSNITCTNCAKTIELHFNKKEDIKAKVLVTASSVIFTYDNAAYDEKYLLDELLSIGYYGEKSNEKNQTRICNNFKDVDK